MTTPASRDELASMIDHAVLSPNATIDDLREGCELVRRLGVGCMCVRPCDVAAARAQLAGARVAVATVVGFPHGDAVTAIKAAEARQAVADGADELDMVLNIGALRSGRLDYVRDDIAAVVAAADGKIVKVILECCYLDRDRKVAACEAAVQAGADFVKTSTGTGPAGATVEDVALLRAHVPEGVGVKAAGGIRTLGDCLAMIEAGATRVGASATESILADF